MTEAAAEPVKSLPEMYYSFVADSIDEEGIRIPHMIVQDTKGALSVYALAVPPQYAHLLLIRESKNPETAELIYGLDRFTQPGQGTEFKDAFCGAWLCNGLWHPFVINYQPEPNKIVRAYDWNNAFWIESIRRELTQRGEVDPEKVVPLVRH